MNKQHVSLLVAILASTLSASATISVSLVADQLRDQNGVPIPVNSLILLVASTTNSSFEPIAPGSSTAVGSQLSGDDYIVYRSFITQDERDYSPGLVYKQIDDANGGALDFASVPGGLWGPGDAIALVWFPTLTGSSSLLTAGSRYGLYTNVAPIDGSAPWITPANGTSNYPLRFFTSDAASPEKPPVNSTNPPSSGFANNQVVPEPTTAGLLGLGIVGLIARRRRQ